MLKWRVTLHIFAIEALTKAAQVAIRGMLHGLGPGSSGTSHDASEEGYRKQLKLASLQKLPVEASPDPCLQYLLWWTQHSGVSRGPRQRRPMTKPISYQKRCKMQERGPIEASVVRASASLLTALWLLKIIMFNRLTLAISHKSLKPNFSGPQLICERLGIKENCTKLSHCRKAWPLGLTE